MARGDRRPADALRPKRRQEDRRAEKRPRPRGRMGERRREHLRHKAGNILHILKELPGFKEERERFHNRRREIMKEAGELRREIWKAIREAGAEGERPDKQKVAEVVKRYRPEAEAIVAKLVQNRIDHEKRKADLMEKNKATIVREVSDELLKPRPPRMGKGQRRRPDGEPGEGRFREGDRRRKNDVRRPRRGGDDRADDRRRKDDRPGAVW